MPRKLKKKGIPLDGLVFTKSEYTRLREHYLREEYSAVQSMLYHISVEQHCQPFRLRHPLFNLLKAIARKLLLNVYECVVFGYLLELNKWDLDCEVIEKYRMDFPDIIYINDPTDQAELKSLSLFLYLSCYSIKEFLNDNTLPYLSQTVKLCPNFEDIKKKWLITQPTTGQELDPRKLNSYYKRLSRPISSLDYNNLVDEILHISPCYGIQKQQKPTVTIKPSPPPIVTIKEQTEPSRLLLFPTGSRDLLQHFDDEPSDRTDML